MSTRADYNDLRELADTYLSPRRCPGNRLIHPDYLCLHCGYDPDGGDCGKPRPGYGREARRKREEAYQKRLAEYRARDRKALEKPTQIKLA